MNTFRFTRLHCLLLNQFHYSLWAVSLVGENAKGRRREEGVASRFPVPTSEPARRLILLFLLDILSTDLNVKYIELIKYHTLSNWKAFQRWSWRNVNQDCEWFPLCFQFAEKSANLNQRASCIKAAPPFSSADLRAKKRLLAVWTHVTQTLFFLCCGINLLSLGGGFCPVQSMGWYFFEVSLYCFQIFKQSRVYERMNNF